MLALASLVKTKLYLAHSLRSSRYCRRVGKCFGGGAVNCEPRSPREISKVALPILLAASPPKIYSARPQYRQQVECKCYSYPTRGRDPKSKSVRCTTPSGQIVAQKRFNAPPLPGSWGVELSIDWCINHEPFVREFGPWSTNHVSSPKTYR